MSSIFNNILATPIILLSKMNYYVAPLLGVMTFLLLFFVPIVITDMLIVAPYGLGIVYILCSLIVVAFAYKGNWIMEKLVFNLTKVEYGKNILGKYTQQRFTRLMSYVLMVTIYMFYNFLSFSGISLEGIFQETILEVILEVFITFIAIDSAIQLYNHYNIKDTEV